MEVRPVRPEEYGEAGRVTALAYREYRPLHPEENGGWEEYLEMIADVAGRADRTRILVAVEHGRILGSVTIELDDVLGDDDKELPPDTAVMRMLGVDPSIRRRGLGRVLVEASIDLVRSSGKRFLNLRTSREMVAPQQLYRSMGFERDPERDLSYPEIDLIAFRLEL